MIPLDKSLNYINSAYISSEKVLSKQIYTPVSQTHANPPHTKKICVGMVPTHKNLCGDVPTHSPRKIFHFFVPTKKLLLLPAIPMHPHISPYIPMHLFCMGMCENLPFKSNICCPHTKFHQLVVPTQKVVNGTRPHAKFLPSVGL